MYTVDPLESLFLDKKWSKSFHLELIFLTKDQARLWHHPRQENHKAAEYAKFDEEALLNMPNLLVNMAEGMLVSPPRINTPSSDDSSDGKCLWSYT